MVIYEWLHTFLWDGIMLPAILLFGGFLLLKSRFYPLTKIKQWMKMTVGSLLEKKNGKEKGNGLSGFQAACTALAAALGTGNIAGVATALTAGGPGAIFWMWISGLFGMMLQYAEIALGTLYQKREPDGTLSGGPMYYMEYGLGKKKMAKLYAALCILASLGVGNMVQTNSMAQGLWDTFSIPPLLSGTVCCILTAAALFGGVKRIGKMAEKLIPVISCLYIGAAFLFLLFRLPALPQALASIFEGAFQFRAGVAGAAGYGIKRAVTIGLARGTFSHEAGMGSGAIAHGASEAESPEKQGMWGIFQVFFDTIVMCTMTALVIMVSGVYNVNIYGEVLSLTGGLASLPDGAALTGIAFSSILEALESSWWQ